MLKINIGGVSEITLLTIEQAERLPKELLSCGEWWWLRSPGSNWDAIAGVNCDGSVDLAGVDGFTNFACVRPAFFVPDLNPKLGAKVQIGNHMCTVIEKDLVLADSVVCRDLFGLTPWDKSYLKKFLGSDEFKEMLTEVGCNTWQ